MIKNETKAFLESINIFPLKKHPSMLIDRTENEETIKQRIKEKVNGKSGIYIYTNADRTEIYYVGKAASLYSRIFCHYKEAVFSEEKTGKKGLLGDAEKGLYPAYFRDFLQEKLTVTWIEINEENYRRLVEEALHYVLTPHFLAFKKEFNKKPLKEGRTSKS